MTLSDKKEIVETKSQETKKVTVVENKKRRIWIGPEVKKQGMARNRIYKGELPQNVKVFVKEYKCGGLLIDCSKFSEVSLKMGEKGNVYEVLEKNLVKKLGGR